MKAAILLNIIGEDLELVSRLYTFKRRQKGEIFDYFLDTKKCPQLLRTVKTIAFNCIFLIKLNLLFIKLSLYLYIMKNLHNILAR